MPVFTDQLGNKISLNKSPKRIISLVPSQSEFLWDIGLKQELVGITKFCIHPKEMFNSLERVGGTKQLDIEKIRALKPDLIIGNKEENSEQQIESLRAEFPVWMSDINTIEDALKMMKSLAQIFKKEDEVTKMIEKLNHSLSRIKHSFAQQGVLYFIWNKPYMGAASQTFIHAVLQHVGLKNVIQHLSRYPELDEKTLKNLNPDYCILSSEPFPFEKKHMSELQKILPNSKIKMVDGEMFSWYGSRLLLLEKYINDLKNEFLMPH